MRPQILLLTIFLAALPLLAVAAATAGKPPAAPWVPIKDLRDRQVRFIANVAVDFDNLKHHCYLVLEDIARRAT